MPGECGSQSVVQIASQPASLLLACQHGELQCPLQVAGQRAAVQNSAEVAGQVIDEAPVSGAQGALGSREQQAADRLAVRRQRHHRRVGASRAAGSDLVVGGEDRDVLQAETFKLGHDVTQQEIGVGRCLEALPELGEDLVRLIPTSVRQSVHGALEYVAQRGERDGDDGGRQPRQPFSALCVEAAPKTCNHEGVEQHHNRGQGEPHQSAVRGAAQLVHVACEDDEADDERQRQRSHREHPAGAGRQGERRGEQGECSRSSEGHNLSALQRLPASPAFPQADDGTDGNGCSDGHRRQGKQTRDRLQRGKRQRVAPLAEPEQVRVVGEQSAQRRRAHHQTERRGQSAPPGASDMAVGEDHDHSDRGQPPACPAYEGAAECEQRDARPASQEHRRGRAAPDRRRRPPRPSTCRH